MNINKTIYFLCPTIEFGIDYAIVGKGTIEWYNKTIPQPTQEELEKAWVKVEKQEKLENLKNEFDSKLNNFLSSYPAGIRETFTLRKSEAQKFIETGKSEFIENLVLQKNIDRKKAKLKEIKTLDFANKIIKKATIFSTAYNKLESWYDIEKEKIINN